MNIFKKKTASRNRVHINFKNYVEDKLRNNLGIIDPHFILHVVQNEMYTTWWRRFCTKNHTRTVGGPSAFAIGHFRLVWAALVRRTIMGVYFELDVTTDMLYHR